MLNEIDVCNLEVRIFLTNASSFTMFVVKDCWDLENFFKQVYRNFFEQCEDFNSNFFRSYMLYMELPALAIMSNKFIILLID